MSETYAKLFGSILDSSIWQESKETRLVWITMLAMKDQFGKVYAAVPGLADRAKVTLDECIAAVEKLSKPDKWSRSKEFEGRRIEAISGGWLILNHAAYTHKMSLEYRREYQRLKQAEYRKRKKEAVLEPKQAGAAAAINHGFRRAARQPEDC